MNRNPAKPTLTTIHTHPDSTSPAPLRAAAGTGMVRSLPRGLDPLPDEALPGYALRLSHRLDLSPARLCALTGLAPRGAHTALTIRTLFALPPDTVTVFATATGLTNDEVHALTLAGLAHRYPPLAPHRLTPVNGRFSAINEKWVFTRFTRYCPDCLAGDGSTIQTRHGGAWQTWWRLPVVFACPTHARLLEHTCPSCTLPVGDLGAHPSSMLRLASISGLHPVACRNPIPTPNWHRLHRSERACQQRLDHAAPPRTRVDHDVLALQTKILDLLRPEGQPATLSAGQPASAAAYFVDLRILTCLISVSWPAARNLIADTEHAGLIDAHAERQHQRIQALRTRGQHVRLASIYDTPPRDAATAVAMLSLTDTIISTADATSVRQLLRRILAAAPVMRPWVKRYLAGDCVGECSPGLHTAIGLEAGAAHVVRQTSGDPHRLRAPQPVRFTIDHLPQHPPPSWCQRFFTDFTDLKPRLLHRAIAVRLAQTCTGSSVHDAGVQLGLPGAAATHAWRRIHAELNATTRTATFDAAIDALAAHLDTITTPINYGRRRAALATWSIPSTDWTHLTDGLTNLPRTRIGHHTDWGDAKRILASTWVWVHITHGEHIYATPIRPNPNQPAPGGPLGEYVHHRWPLIATATRGHYPLLRHRLKPYADQLAADIDKNQPNIATSRQGR